MVVKCNGCGFKENDNCFKESSSPYHDLMCPKCGTTDLDTSELYFEWGKFNRLYGFGKDNTILME